MWQDILRKNIRTFEALKPWVPTLEVNTSFPLNIPLRIAKKMTPEPNDPLVLQFVPQVLENEVHPGFGDNPVGDLEAIFAPKLLQKYQGRVLVVTTGACAMHCRYCFRREYPYEKERGFEAELAWIEKDQSVEEVLLSGGDPLSLSDRSLKHLLLSLEKIPHVKRVRFHTRFPIGIPERVDLSFLETLEVFSGTKIVMLHVNHPIEYDEAVFEAISRLRQRGVLLFVHTVLLKGVNDSFEVLKTLFQTSVDMGVIPYYLYQLDKVAGAHHFLVPESKGKALVEQLREHLPGYQIPKYVVEVSGKPFKVPL